jgi:hypothetical protein
MPVTVETLGRQFQISASGSVTRRYFARGAATELEASTAVLAYLVADLGTPPNIGGLVFQDITGTERVKEGWECEASWGQFQQKEVPQAGASEFSFEFQVQPVKVVIPVSPQRVYKRGDDPLKPPKIALIGDQGLPDTAPEGVEVYEPTHCEQETHYLASSAITPTYKAQMKSLLGRTNAAAFKGSDAGECLLQSVQGQKRGSEDWQVSFRWAVRENQADLDIDGIVVASKGGWEYLWPRYHLKKAEGDPEGEGDEPVTLSRHIRYIVVAQVFRPGDYSLLGIGS